MRGNDGGPFGGPLLFTYGFDGNTRVIVSAQGEPSSVPNASQLLRLVLGTYTTSGDVNVDMRVRVLNP
jgi:hypothetical protein